MEPSTDILDAKGYTRDIFFAALKECHERKIAHRDIKPENIVIDEHGRCKFCDFALGVQINEDDDERIFKGGSLPYMPPEVIAGKCTDPFKGDIYSLGITLLTIFSGDTPWECESRERLKREILSGALSMSSSLPLNFKLLIKSMDRVSIDELAVHPLITASIFPRLNRSKLSPSPSSKGHRRSLGVTMHSSSIVVLRKDNWKTTSTFLTPLPALSYESNIIN